MPSPVSHHQDGSTTYSWEQKTDSPNNQYKQGDSVSITYDANGLPELTTIWRKDGTVEQWSTSDDRATQTYTKWAKAGGKEEENTIRITEPGAGSLVGGFIASGQRYDADGVPIVEAGQTPPPNVAPSAVTPPAIEPPTKSQSNQRVKEDLDDVPYGLGNQSTSGLPPLALGFVPTGSAEDMIADLVSRGFSVEQTEVALFAQKGDEYIIISEGVIEIGKGERYGRIDVANDTLVLQDSTYGDAKRYVLSELSGQPVLMSGTLVLPSLDDASSAPATTRLDSIEPVPEVWTPKKVIAGLFAQHV